MSATSESTRRPQARSGSEGAALVWLDAMVIGICTPEAFLSAMRDIYKEGDEQGWEILSLIDQYYRRGKIKLELFQWLKTRLGNMALGGPDLDTPTLRPQAAAPRVAASPPTKPMDAVEPPPSAPAAIAPRPVAPPPPAAKAAASAAPAATAKSAPIAAAPPVAPLRPREPATGDVLRQRYQLRSALGNSSTGTVFEAIDDYRLDWPSTSQNVAIKVLYSKVSRDEETLNELQRQFQHMQLLSHPNIVRAFEFDRDGEVAFFSMELLRGVLLSRVLNARIGVPLPRSSALCIMRDVGGAMAYSHSRGILHGDLNPQNVFITNDGELRVMDFGVSYKLLQDRWAQDLELAKRAPVAAPGYASVQLLEGQQPDARDDVFALACLSYVLLSGVHPFPSLSSVEAFAQGHRPRRPAGLSSSQWQVLREGLRWDRERRPADVRRWLARFDFSGAAPRLPSLTTLVNATPTRRSSWSVMLGAVLLIAVIGAAAYWATTDYGSLSQRISDWTRQLRSSSPPADIQSGPAPQAPAEVQAPTPPVEQPRAPAPSALPPTQAVSIAAKPVVPPKAAPPVIAAETVVRSTLQPSAKIELAMDTVDVLDGAPLADIPVRRIGNIHGDVTFTWWTESGTAKPTQDFSPIVPRVEHIEDGKSGVHLSVPLSGNPRTQTKSFYVVIDRTDSGAPLGKRTLTMVTLHPAE